MKSMLSGQLIAALVLALCIAFILAACASPAAQEKSTAIQPVNTTPAPAPTSTVVPTPTPTPTPEPIVETPMPTNFYGSVFRVPIEPAGDPRESRLSLFAAQLELEALIRYFETDINGDPIAELEFEYMGMDELDGEEVYKIQVVYLDTGASVTYCVSDKGEVYIETDMYGDIYEYRKNNERKTYNWDGEYFNSFSDELTITKYNGKTFQFVISADGDTLEGTAKIDPKSKVDATWKDLSFKIVGEAVVITLFGNADDYHDRVYCVGFYALSTNTRR